ncbi:MAG: hypothetical protein J2P34_03195, partial [Actinobacteria bacterium]|nr:hypothetical protein [Actinomycetota bacterium]
MSRAEDGQGGWAGTARRLAAGPRAPAVAGVVLGLLSLAETAVRLAVAPGSVGRLALTHSSARSVAPGPGAGLAVPPVVHTGVGAETVVVLCLVCLATTLPLAFLRPAGAAVAVIAASVLSIAAFQSLTGAGAAAGLIALYRLGRRGPAPLAAALAMPFLILALTGRTGTETGILTVLLAALAPAAAWSGIAEQARHEALAGRTARQAIAGSLLEHTARGERARIARELHDVVA